MHVRRRNVLFQTLQALIDGRRLAMTDLSRSWPMTWVVSASV